MPGIVSTEIPQQDWDVHLRLPPVRALPPAISSPCTINPCPRTIRRDPTHSSQYFFRPLQVHRFNLVVPTSLIEKHFNVHTVLQSGLHVVFRVGACRGLANDAQTLGAVHGCVSRHVNPIGFTSYRVSGQQPSGVAAGCSLLGWSAEDGCLVVEVAPRQTEAVTQVTTPAPVQRLFADCLPSPATVRKPLRCMDADQGSQQQLRVPDTPCQSPLLRRFPSGDHHTTACATTSEEEPQQTQPQTASATSTNIASDSADLPPPLSCDEEHSDDSTSDSMATEVTQLACPILKGPLRKGPARGQEQFTIAGEGPAQQPKRHRRRPDWYGQEPEPASLHEGIDLLLAAHLALCQQENGRPKRVRQAKTII